MLRLPNNNINNNNNNNNNNKISHRIGEHYFTDKSVLTQFPLSTINT